MCGHADGILSWISLVAPVNKLVLYVGGLGADARLAPGAVEGALRFCRRNQHPWGYCETKIEGAAPLLRVSTRLTEGRARLLRTPYGDQGILVKRAVYEHLGGYAEVPLMEDVLLARALRPYGPPGRVPALLYLDGRRWKHYGVLGTTLRNWWTLTRFSLLGTPPARLAAGYHRDAAAADTSAADVAAADTAASPPR